MFRKLLRVQILTLLIIPLSFVIFTMEQGVAITSGFLLSSIFVVSSTWIIDRFWDADQNLFLKVFFFSLIVRFILVLSVFGILLGTTKIDEIYFTVSFIISYLCQSITEMIFFNQVLQKKSNSS